MNIRIWFSALALSGLFLTSWVQACGLQDRGATYYDPVSRLEIQKCAVGQKWSNKACIGDTREFNWDDAVRQYGQGDLRLITVDEAKSVVNRSKGCAGIGYSWTSSLNMDRRSDGWNVSFINGVVVDYGRSGAGEIRLVRASQP